LPEIAAKLTLTSIIVPLQAVLSTQNTLFMPIDKINGVNLYWELSGSDGEPLVLVHGSWGDHHNWDSVVKGLSQSFRVLTYDRRGHSRSERLEERDNSEQDVSDLIALTEKTGLAPAHIAGNSGGAAIVLKTAARKPDLFRSLVVHEPPLFGLLKNIPEAQTLLEAVNSHIYAVAGLIEKGKEEEAAQLFVETIAIGPGAWKQLPQPIQQTFIYNAPTFLDETLDSESLYINTDQLSSFDKPALLSCGTESPPFFTMVVEQLLKAIPNARKIIFEGAGHVPHLSNPEQYIDVLKDFCLTKIKG
jgi:pimeloyl-ACP methyl ester carboxylesterase